MREAHRLMAELERSPAREGKMFGVLVGATPDGESVVLRAFSGWSEGRPYAPGFVGPTRPARATAEAERRTLDALARLSGEIESIQTSTIEAAIAALHEQFDSRIDPLVAARKRKKRARAFARAYGVPESTEREFEAASQREGGRIRALRREKSAALAPLERDLEARIERRAHLRKKRRDRSRVLQRAMHETHGLVNFAGRYAKLEEFFAAGVPTGTGECCAPKLLHEAALRGIRPSGVAEFWWGPSPASRKREHRVFYPPCEEKCVPILGHLLCGLNAPAPGVAVLHEEDEFLVVEKPAGLLSVPGRGSAHADCAETRLSLLHPGEFIRAVHRLDQATSGILVLARSPEAHRRLGAAFAEGCVEKRYLARVSGIVEPAEGEIRLPIGADPSARPLRKIDEQGRMAITRFEVHSRGDSTTDVWLYPQTGRTHQLRIHCASPEGLGAPIVGDPLYGQPIAGMPLHLHAERIVLPRRDGNSFEVVARRPRGWM